MDINATCQDFNARVRSPAFDAHFNSVHFLSVLPIHPAGIDFKLKLGSGALFERFAAAGAGDLMDLTRPPVA